MGDSGLIGREVVIEFLGPWEQWPISPQQGGCPFFGTVKSIVGDLLEVERRFSTDRIWLNTSTIKSIR